MLKAVMFIWLQRQFATSYMEIFNRSPFQLISEKTYQWTLLEVSQYQLTGRVTATTRYWSSLIDLQKWSIIY